MSKRSNSEPPVNRNSLFFNPSNFLNLFPQTTTTKSSSPTQQSPTIPSPTPDSDTLLKLRQARVLKRTNISTPPPDHPPQDPSCICHSVIQDSDPRFCLKCHGYLQPIGRIQNECQFLNTQIEQCNQKLETLSLKAEQDQGLVSILKLQAANLQEQIYSKEAEISIMRKDLDTLGEKLLDEVEKRAEMAHSKEAVQDELEELTRNLFEEANSMVASESRLRHAFEVQELELKKNIETLNLQLQMEQSQLRELKLRMEQVMLENSKIKKVTVLKSMNIQALTENDDPMLFLQFEDFLDLGPKTKFNRINTIPYLKVALEDDVMPCLRFGGNPKISPKKIIDAIITNACFVEEMTASQIKALELRDDSVPLSESVATSVQNIKDSQEQQERGDVDISTSSLRKENTRDDSLPTGNPKTMFSRLSDALNSASQSVSNSIRQSNIDLGLGCATCGKTSEPYKYQFKITDISADIWYPICLHCRARIVSVCNFYNFIRHVRQGLYSTRKKKDIYAETVQLKRRMFDSRIGYAVGTAHELKNREGDVNMQNSIEPNNPFGDGTIQADALLN